MLGYEGMSFYCKMHLKYGLQDLTFALGTNASFEVYIFLCTLKVSAF